jgi:hypothetical protein
MFKIKGLYEWSLVDMTTGETQTGSQWNIASDNMIRYMLTGPLTQEYNGSTYAVLSGLAIQLSDTIPTPGVEYRKKGASNNFNILAASTVQSYNAPYNVDWSLHSKYASYNFSPPVAPRTITVIGIKIYGYNEADIYRKPNFSSFIELSTPIVQSTLQYLFVKYTLFVAYTAGVSYRNSSSRYLEFCMNNIMFYPLGSYLLDNTQNTNNYSLTTFRPADNIDYVERAVDTLYTSVPENIVLNTGSFFGQTISKTFEVTEVVGPIGCITYKRYGSQYFDNIANTGYANMIYGNPQDKTNGPSISRVYVHPANKRASVFSDPAYPASSQGAINLTGTPTNLYPMIGRVCITKTGDASDLIDEAVASTSIDTTGNTLTVAQDLTTGDKYRVTTTGTLPDPLVVLTDYYIIRIDSTTIKLATSYANALDSIFIDITTQGTGTHTFIRQNTGEYRLELEPWAKNQTTSLDTGTTLSQLPMAVDFDGYVMPMLLENSTVNNNAYAEGDYLAVTNLTAAYTERAATAINLGSSMIRGTAQNGSYIYSVQQSRKNLINNICRWPLNSIETSQALCKFGTGTTKVCCPVHTATKMYITTNDGIYEYTFASPTVAPTLLSITGMISTEITDACLDPITGYLWTGHATGLSKINLSTLTATQYISGSGQALEGMDAATAYIIGGQLEAYNGRVLRGGHSSLYTVSVNNVVWVLDDGIGYYYVNGSNTDSSCAALRQGTNQVVCRTTSEYKLYTVTVTGVNTGSSVLNETISSSLSGRQHGSLAQYSSDTFIACITQDYGDIEIERYTVAGSAVRSYSRWYIGTTGYYFLGFAWLLGALQRNRIDLDGNGTYATIWFDKLITIPFNTPTRYGWDGSAWVKDNPNSRRIIKTGTHALTSGVSVDFNNATGGASWDQQFVSGEYFTYVYGPTKIKDNLQTLTCKSRHYVCDARVVELLACTVPGSGSYTYTIPEISDPDFRDMDTVDFITEIFEGATRYTQYALPTGDTYTPDYTTNIYMTTVNIATGTPVVVTSSGNVPEPLEVFKIYFVINLSPTTFRLATTYANAVGGTAIALTDNGTGTHTVKQIAPTTTTYYAGINGIFVFSSTDASKNLTLTYTYTKYN